jgi:hypothetical protein
MVYFGRHSIGNGSSMGYALWGLVGAALLGISAPLTNGRILSLIFLRGMSAGTPLRKATPLDYSHAGAFLALGGVYLALWKTMAPITHFEGWRLYVAFPLVCILIFGWMPILWRIQARVIFPIGCVSFVIGAWRFYLSFRG